mgnify:CR=1 FL=1
MTNFFDRVDAVTLPHVARRPLADWITGTISAPIALLTLMNLLQQGFPKAQMMVCGVLGPKSNAHGPNEFLHLPYAKRLTAAVAQVIAAHP